MDWWSGKEREVIWGFLVILIWEMTLRCRVVHEIKEWKVELLTLCVCVFVCVCVTCAQSLSHVRLCNPMDCSMPGLPVHHQLLGLTQTHAHWVGDAIQPSHPLSTPSPLAFNLSQHQGLFKWLSSSYQVAKVLELQLQHQSFQWIFRTDLLQNGLVGSPCSPRDSQESSPTPQFKSISSSALSFILWTHPNAAQK